MLRLLGWIGRQTIWARGAIPESEGVYRTVRRIWLPAVDLVFMLIGLSARRFGVPTLSGFFTVPEMETFGRIIFWAGFAALIGVVFPRLWPLEIIAKSVLSGAFTAFVVAVLALTTVGYQSRGFTAGLAIIAVILCLIRLSGVAAERRDARARKVLTDRLGRDL